MINFFNADFSCCSSITKVLSSFCFESMCLCVLSIILRSYVEEDIRLISGPLLKTPSSLFNTVCVRARVRVCACVRARACVRMFQKTQCSSHQCPTLTTVSTETQHNWYLSPGNIARYLRDTELLAENRHTQSFSTVTEVVHFTFLCPDSLNCRTLQCPLLMRNKHTQGVNVCLKG